MEEDSPTGILEKNDRIKDKGDFQKEVQKQKNQTRKQLEESIQRLDEQYKLLEDNCGNPDLSFKLKKYSSIHNLARKTIEENIKNLQAYLNEFDLTSNNLNRKCYLEKAIFNEEQMESTNLTEFKLNYEDSILTKAIRDKILEHAHKDSIATFTISNENLQEDIMFLNKSGEKIRKLLIENVKKNTEFIFNKNMKYEKIEELEVKDCTINLIEQGKNQDNHDRFGKLEKLVLYDITFTNLNPDENSNNNYYIPLYPFETREFFPSIQVLRLEKAQLVDKDFKEIFEGVISNSGLKNSLISLSFAHNYITCVNYIKDEENKQILPFFSNIEELNFMNNRIYRFVIKKYIMFENLVCINLMNNYIGNELDVHIECKLEKIQFEIEENSKKAEDKSQGQEIKIEESKINKKQFKIKMMSKCVKLYNQNPYLIEKNNIESYKQSLYDIFKANKSELLKLTMFSYCGLFDSTNQNELITLLMSVQMHKLTELDLSYCFITSDSAKEIFRLSIQFPMLKCLNLKGNLIDMSLFNTLEKESLNNFHQVEELNLSSNRIEDEDFGNMIKLLTLFPKLNHLDLTLNPFGRNYVCRREKENDNDKNKQTSVYLIDDNERMGPNYNFCGLIGKYYPSTKKFYLDFTIDIKEKESKDVRSYTLEQQKKEYKITKKQIR